jgi:hypothetical protein
MLTSIRNIFKGLNSLTSSFANTCEAVEIVSETAVQAGHLMKATITSSLTDMTPVIEEVEETTTK